MEYIPYHIRFKLSIDTIILQKIKNGWDKIHEDIKKYPLYLIKTHFVYDDMFYFNYIIRINTMKMFMNKKKYTWLRRMKENPIIYYYKPIQEYCLYNINDLFSNDFYQEIIERRIMLQ